MGLHGKIVYLEIPTDDVEASARFYQTVFGWRTRRRGDGALAFDDCPPSADHDAGSGTVSGAWRTGRPPVGEAGLVLYMNVDDVAESVRTVTAAGGVVVQDVGGDPGELTARFLDPYGNLMGLYQEPVS